MNINSMIMKIKSFNDYIVDSGFFRDIQEFLKTISQTQNNQNIVLLRDIINKVLQHLNVIINSDVPNDLKLLLPMPNIELFSPKKHLEELDELVADAQIDTAQSYAKLNKILTDIKNQLTSNQAELNKLQTVLMPYYEKDKEIFEKAVISFIFRDADTINNLKRFAQILERWNRTLHIYHQLTSSKSPKDVELVNIQNGSLDVILNINLDIALSLTEIVKCGFLVFGGYLAYKSKVHEIVETYFGDKQLIKSEEERESRLLNNIGETIKRKLLEQHKDFIKKDKKINKESINKKVDEVSRVLAEHIVKGNDIKLLIDFPDEVSNEDAEGQDQKNTLIEETSKASFKVRKYLRDLTTKETKLLIDKYTMKEGEEKA